MPINHQLQISVLTMRGKTILSSPLLMLSAMPAHCDDNIPSDSIWRNVDLEQVVVTGTRTPKLQHSFGIRHEISCTHAQGEILFVAHVLLRQELPWRPSPRNFPCGIGLFHRCHIHVQAPTQVGCMGKQHSLFHCYGHCTVDTRRNARSHQLLSRILD